MSRIKLIALDIDGVLNNFIDKECYNSDKYTNFSKHNVKLLNSIIKKASKKTPVKILLSSSWRKDYATWFGINCLFEATGITPCCIDKTPDHNGGPRGNEILSWLIENQLRRDIFVESLCILDDDNDMGILMPWLVNTDGRTGITIQNANDAIEMLNKPFSLTVNLGSNGN